MPGPHSLYNHGLVVNDLLMKAHPSGGASILEDKEGKVEDTIETQMKILEIIYRDPVVTAVEQLSEKLQSIGAPTLAKHARVIASQIKRIAIESVEQKIRENKDRNRDWPYTEPAMQPAPAPNRADEIAAAVAEAAKLQRAVNQNPDDAKLAQQFKEQNDLVVRLQGQQAPVRQTTPAQQDKDDKNVQQTEAEKALDEKRWKIIEQYIDRVNNDGGSVYWFNHFDKQEFKKILRQINSYYRGFDPSTGKKSDNKLSAADYKKFLMNIVNPETKYTQVLREAAVGYLVEHFSGDPDAKRMINSQKGKDAELDKEITQAEDNQKSNITPEQINKRLRGAANHAADLIYSLMQNFSESSNNVRNNVLAFAPKFVETSKRIADELRDATIDNIDELNVSEMQHSGLLESLKKLRDAPALAPQVAAYEKILNSLMKLKSTKDMRTIYGLVDQIGNAAGVRATQQKEPNEPGKDTAGAGKTDPGATKDPNAPAKPGEATAPGNKGTKSIDATQDEVSHIDFIATTNGNTPIKRFPIFYVISEARKNPSTFFNALKAYGAIPNEWTEQEFFGTPDAKGNLSYPRQQEVRALINAIYDGTKTTVEAKGQKFEDNYDKALSWLDNIMTAGGKKQQAAATNDILVWLRQKFPEKMGKIMTSEKAKDEIVDYMIGAHFATADKQIVSPFAEDNVGGQVRRLVDHVIRENGLENAKAPSPQQSTPSNAPNAPNAQTPQAQQAQQAQQSQQAPQAQQARQAPQAQQAQQVSNVIQSVDPGDDGELNDEQLRRTAVGYLNRNMTNPSFKMQTNTAQTALLDSRITLEQAMNTPMVQMAVDAVRKTQQQYKASPGNKKPLEYIKDWYNLGDKTIMWR